MPLSSPSLYSIIQVVDVHHSQSWLVYDMSLPTLMVFKYGKRHEKPTIYRSKLHVSSRVTRVMFMIHDFTPLNEAVGIANKDTKFIEIPKGYLTQS